MELGDNVYSEKERLSVRRLVKWAISEELVPVGDVKEVEWDILEKIWRIKKRKEEAGFSEPCSISYWEVVIRNEILKIAIKRYKKSIKIAGNKIPVKLLVIKKYCSCNKYGEEEIKFNLEVVDTSFKKKKLKRDVDLVTKELSELDRDICNFIRAGYTQEETADKLKIKSRNTVRNHLDRMQKNFADFRS